MKKSPKTETVALVWEWWCSLLESKLLSYSRISSCEPPYLCLHPAEWSQSCSCVVSQGWGPQSVQGGQPGGQTSPPQHYAHTLVSSYWQRQQVNHQTPDLHTPSQPGIEAGQGLKYNFEVLVFPNISTVYLYYTKF